MPSNSFVLLNGRTKSDCPAQFTFSSAVRDSVVDLIWVNILGLELIEEIRVSFEVTFSDHCPVTLDFTTPDEIIDPVAVTTEACNKQTSKLWLPEYAEKFSKELLISNKLAFDLNNSTSDTQYENLSLALTEAADRAGMRKLGSRRNFKTL